MSSKKKRSKQRSNGLKKIGKRLAAYSAAAAATVVASQERAANAAEVIHDIDPDIAVGATPGTLFNVISGVTAPAPGATGNSAVGSFRVGTWGGYAYIAGPANSVAAAFVGAGGIEAVDVYPDLLNASSAVSVGRNFCANNEYLSYGQYGYLSNFANARGFVGLRFNIGRSPYYGWAEVSGVGGDLTLHGFGYNDVPRAASHPVPEPSSIMLLAAGAAGLGFWRKRRAGKAA